MAEEITSWLKEGIFIDMDMSIIPNHDGPLLVKGFINNKEVHWLLVLDIG